MRNVREQFLVEITGEVTDDDPTGSAEGGSASAGGTGDQGRHVVGDLDELNRLFTGWVEIVYHRRVHSETGQTPMQRWNTVGPFPLPTPAALAEAFAWGAQRTVTKTALVSLQDNTYQVDPALAGHRVACCDRTAVKVSHLHSNSSASRRTCIQAQSSVGRTATTSTSTRMPARVLPTVVRTG